VGQAEPEHEAIGALVRSGIEAGALLYAVLFRLMPTDADVFTP
jgi:hypothetical protein